MGKKTQPFLKLVLLIFIQFTIITGCANIFKSSDRISNGSETTPSSIELDSPAVTLPYPEPDSPVVTPPYPEPDLQTPTSIFFVSLEGNNTDGKSWETAWNELDQIQWVEVNPGDIITIAGGEYHTQMEVENSGTPGLPITITTNGQQVVLDGQRPILPYCEETNYNSVEGDDGIDLGSQSYIVIDGQDWSGIVIRNHLRGIKIRPQASNIIVRNVEIYDNGYARDMESSFAPDGPGVRLGGSDILFERVIIHDNGQDAFQAGWGVWNFTLRNSWLYNSKEHPTVPGKPFNYCTHTDGIQIFDGGVQGPIFIEDSIIGPSFTQGVIIGSLATVDNVVIRNTLFVGNDNSGIIISDGGQSSNWTLQNVTIAQDVTDERSWNLQLYGNKHRITDSVFYGGKWGIGIFNWSEANGNINWMTPDEYNVAEEMDPMFIDDDYSLIEGEHFADFDFTITNTNIPTHIGSSITSVKQLFEITTQEITDTSGE